MDVDYDAGVNGDFFVLVIKLDYNPPALFNAIGGKYDRYGSSSGAWSAGNVIMLEIPVMHSLIISRRVVKLEITG
jgi:hypothetical protein